MGKGSSRQRCSDRIYLTPGHKIQPLFPLTGGAVSWDHYTTVACFLKQAHARLLTYSHSGSIRTLLHAFWEPRSLAPHPSTPSDIQDTLQLLLMASDSGMSMLMVLGTLLQAPRSPFLAKPRPTLGAAALY